MARTGQPNRCTPQGKKKRSTVGGIIKRLGLTTAVSRRTDLSNGNLKCQLKFRYTAGKRVIQSDD
jgi:hypothetical protein